MLHPTTRRLPFMVITSFLLLLTTVLIGCGNIAPSTLTPTSASHLPSPTPTLPSFACDQPAPVSGKLTFAGLGYGPYHIGQDPSIRIGQGQGSTVGIFPSIEEIQADMPTLRSLTNYIRIYSSTGSAKAVVQAAEANHICVALGVSLGSDRAANDREILAAEQLASSYGAVRTLVLGNEVFLHPKANKLTAADFRSYIQEVRSKLPHMAITIADTYDQWVNNPELTQLAEDVDFIMVHIYPFWHDVSIDHAMQALDDAYNSVKDKFPGKPIVIGETGWPSAGQPLGDAVPSEENQARYLHDFTQWAQEKSVPYFYFAAFDEDWKTSEKGGVGPHWGLYQQDARLKPQLQDILPPADPETLKERSFRDVYVGSGLEKPFDLGVNTSENQHDWVTAADGVLTLAYPAGQQWGAVLITVRTSVPPEQRNEDHALDLSAYNFLVFDMRAEVDGQCIKVGIKDWQQPDDGTEQKVDECLTTEWKTYTQDLSAFSQADRTHLYVVFEVVFAGATNMTIQLKNIRYSPAE